MATLATFHARWWDHPPLEWTCHPEVGLGSMLFRSPYYKSVLKEAIPALKAWPGNPYEKVLEWCPMLLKRMHTIVAHLREGPYTLLHNDVHLDNIFFTDSGGCSFIDMSNMIFGNSLQDVAYFLATNLTPEFGARMSASSSDTTTGVCLRAWESPRRPSSSSAGQSTAADAARVPNFRCLHGSIA